MSLFKCKMCGGDLEIAEGVTIAECEYCGTKQTVPKAMDENLQNLFNRANTLRIKSEFDKAEKLYEDAKAQVDYWIGQMMKLEKAARGNAAAMGMTVSDRCRLVIPKAAQPEEPDPLEALLARISG